jgi:hypothetical protein
MRSLFLRWCIVPIIYTQITVTLEIKRFHQGITYLAFSSNFQVTDSNMVSDYKSLLENTEFSDYTLIVETEETVIII